jgi:hypothetical protein
MQYDSKYGKLEAWASRRGKLARQRAWNKEIVIPSLYAMYTCAQCPSFQRDPPSHLNVTDKDKDIMIICYCGFSRELAEPIDY